MPARFHGSARPDIRTPVTSTQPGLFGTPLETRSDDALTEGAATSVPFRADGLLTCVRCLRRCGSVRHTPSRPIVCGPCWFAAGGTAAPSELTGVSHAPPTNVPSTAGAWLRAVVASEWFTARRRDCAARLRRLLTVLARHADWTEHTSWPTWERLMQQTGWGRSTMSGWLAELQRLGWLQRVEQGSTPRFRPMALAGIQGNRAAVYQLRIPTNWTPTHSRSESVRSHMVVPPRARPAIHRPVQPARQNKQPNGHEAAGARCFDHRSPSPGPQMLAAATELRDADPALRLLRSRQLRRLLAPWWKVGWTNTDIVFALSHAPVVGGVRTVERCPAEQLRRPDRWVTLRMAVWAGPDGPHEPPRRWRHIQDQVISRFGKAAGARLPYGAATLTPEDLQVDRAERDAAAHQLVRRWAREFLDARDARRPDEEVATPEVAKRMWRLVCDQIRHHDRDVPDQGDEPDQGTEPDGPWERALARARAEGRAARLRSSRPRRRRL